MKKCLLIINPKSGQLKIQNKLLEIIELLNENSYDVNVKVTLHSRHAFEIASSAFGYDMIICSGGDGTLNQVTSGLVHSNISTPLGYIPSGSANDYATSLNIPKEPLEAAKKIINGKEYNLDIGLLNSEHYFNYVASFGLFTAISYNTPQASKNIFGKAAYLLNGITDLINIKTYHVKINSNGNIYENDYILGLVLNTTSVGGIMKLNPIHVDLRDGLFEVLLVKKPKDIIEQSKIIEGLINSDYSLSCFDFFRTDEVDFIIDDEISWSLDGEECPLGREVNIINLKEKISLII